MRVDEMSSLCGFKTESIARKDVWIGANKGAMCIAV